MRELLPRGLARGTVVAVAEFGLLCLALAAAASADGAWCGIAGLPEAGVLAAAGLGLDVGRILLVPEPGPAWPQVVASLLDGCDLVLLRPPAGQGSNPPAGQGSNPPAGQGSNPPAGRGSNPPAGQGSNPPAGRASNPVPAQVRRRLEATLRRGRGVLLVAGDWPGAQYRLRVVTRRWTGLGDGRGRLRACCAEVVADGRGEAAMTRTRWLWLPGGDGRVTLADPRDFPADLPPGVPAGIRPAGFRPDRPPGVPASGLARADPDQPGSALRAVGG